MVGPHHPFAEDAHIFGRCTHGMLPCIFLLLIDDIFHQKKLARLEKLAHFKLGFLHWAAVQFPTHGTTRCVVIPNGMLH